MVKISLTNLILIDDALAVVLVVVLSGQSDIKPYFPKRLHAGACRSGFACAGHDTSFPLIVTGLLYHFHPIITRSLSKMATGKSVVYFRLKK